MDIIGVIIFVLVSSAATIHGIYRIAWEGL